MAGPGARLQDRRIEDQGTAGSGPAEARGPFRCESLSRGGPGIRSCAARHPGAKHRGMAEKRKTLMPQPWEEKELTPKRLATNYANFFGSQTVYAVSVSERDAKAP